MVHGFTGNRMEVIDNRENMFVVGNNMGNLDEGGGYKGAIEVEREPPVARLGRGSGNMTG